VEGKVSLPVEIGGTVVESRLAITKELPTPMILGNDTLSTSKVTIDYQEGVLKAKRSIPFQVVMRKTELKNSNIHQSRGKDLPTAEEGADSVTSTQKESNQQPWIGSGTCSGCDAEGR
jgi:hypothetical protein